MINARTVVGRIRILALALALTSLGGCTFRHRLSSPLPARFPPDQRIELWRGGRQLVLREVTIESGTVRGTVLPWRPHCDSCRVAIPLVEADSLVRVNSEAGWFAGGTVALITLWVYAWHCWPSRACLD